MIENDAQNRVILPKTPLGYGTLSFAAFHLTETVKIFPDRYIYMHTLYKYLVLCRQNSEKNETCCSHNIFFSQIFPDVIVFHETTTHCFYSVAKRPEKL